MKASHRFLQLWFAIMGRITPARAERRAAEIFLTPRPRRPRPAATPPSGIAAQRLALDAGGFHLAGWSWGDGPTVLLIHGWSGLADDMAPLAAGLALAGYRAVFVDLPAHGASPGNRTSLGEWVRLLPALAAAVGGVHAVIGHSLGASAVGLALEAGLPARGAVLVAPPLGPRPFIRRVAAFVGLPTSRVPGMEQELVHMVGGELNFFDLSRAARALRLPVLILHDPDDDEVPFAHGQAVAAAWAGSVFEAVQGEGHYRILRAPAVVARIVAFVSGL